MKDINRLVNQFREAMDIAGMQGSLIRTFHFTISRVDAVVMLVILQTHYVIYILTYF
jgi:hypothetical protein